MENKVNASGYTVLSPAPGPQQTHEQKVEIRKRGRPAGQHATMDNALIEATQATDTINTEQETLGELVGKHAIAQANGDEWLETSQKNYDALVPRNNGSAKYFCYKGVKLTVFGKIPQIENDESKTAHDRMHPGAQTTVISG